MPVPGYMGRVKPNDVNAKPTIAAKLALVMIQVMRDSALHSEALEVVS
jgi:hypothetical protein